LLGNLGELLAIREITAGKFLVVVYKETGPGDGFIITAFLTRKVRQLILFANETHHSRI
jgi:phospholipid N-methyltransferase